MSLIVLLMVVLSLYFAFMMNLRQALEVLQSGEWVALRMMTADVRKGSGGVVHEWPRVKICRDNPVNVPDHRDRSSSQFVTADDINTKSKDPNHNTHFTRNVEFPGKQIRKVHPILITHINNTPVL
jgi:hypothetical protein